MKIFLDTNIFLDLLLGREKSELAANILSKSSDWVRFYISFLTVANSAYVMRKLPQETMRKRISVLLKYCNILPMNEMQALDALHEDTPDFEDKLQILCAEYGDCDVIITSNTLHFKPFTAIPVITPEEFR